MKSFRWKFISLGLLLFVCNVLCLNCGSEYDDAASNGFLSDVVVVGRVSQVLPLGYEKYKATIRIRGKRDIIKGASILKKGSVKGRKAALLTIGVFEDIKDSGGKVSGAGDCEYSLTRDIQYIFFLNTTSQKKYFSVTALPISEQMKKEFKRGKKDIKKILCKSGDCVTPPILDPRRVMKDTSVQFGKSLELNCKLKKRSFPVTKFIWFKDSVDITQKSEKGFSIKDNKKGSVLRIKKTDLSDNGTYECVAKNVAGEIKQQAVIKITGVNAPEAGSGSMKDKRQKFRGTLKLNCKIKKGALPKAEFFWYKDGQLITTGFRKGLSIRNRMTNSKLRKKPFLQSDAGVYLCKAKNAYGEINQTSNVTVINAPRRTEECGEKDRNWCIHGTCMVYVELKDKYCTCPPNYKGKRCEEFNVIDIKKLTDGEHKLAQDRNLVIVGIISGILLFIGICVASYFLAKRRRDQFYRRRRQRNNGNIEDNIPQIYRPLIGCDDIDGLKKQMAGFGVPKGTQTMETCFVGEEKNNLHLYINPMPGYLGNKNERKTAVSMENTPRPVYKGSNESLEKQKNEHPESNSDNNNKSNPGSKRNSINNSASDGGPSEIFKLMNDLNPKKKSGGADNPANTGANKPNIPTAASPTSAIPPALNLDTDSEDDVLNDDVPLTPLHISEDDEDNNATFPKMKPKTNNVNAGITPEKMLNETPRNNSSNSNRSEAKSKQHPSKQPPPQSQPRHPHPKQQQPHPNQHPRQDPRQDPRQELRQDSRQDPRQESRQDPRQEPRQESRQDPRHEPRHKPRQEPRQESRQEPRPEPRQDTRHDPRLEPRFESRHNQREQHRQQPRQPHQHPSEPPPQQQQNPNSQQHPVPKHPNPPPRQQHNPNNKQNPPRQQTPLKQPHHHPARQHQQHQKHPRQPRTDNKPVKQNEARESPGDKLYASTSSSGYSDSDSSTTTEGCDSPDTAFVNSQDLSEQAAFREATPTTTTPTAENDWNEHGSLESRQAKVSSKYKPPPDIGISRDQYYSASGPNSPGRKGAGVRDHGRNHRQSR